MDHYKLVLPLSNACYLSLKASLVQKLLTNQTRVLIQGHPVYCVVICDRYNHAAR